MFFVLSDDKQNYKILTFVKKVKIVSASAIVFFVHFAFSTISMFPVTQRFVSFYRETTIYNAYKRHLVGPTS